MSPDAGTWEPASAANTWTPTPPDSGGGDGPDLSDATPQALGTAGPGEGTEAARDDHVHPMPDAADIPYTPADDPDESAVWDEETIEHVDQALDQLHDAVAYCRQNDSDFATELAAEVTARGLADDALTTALAGKAPSTHTHAQSDITGLEAELAGKATSAYVDALDGTVATKADKSYVDTQLAGKAASSHTHAKSDITDLVSDLSALAAAIAALQADAWTTHLGAATPFSDTTTETTMLASAQTLPAMSPGDAVALVLPFAWYNNSGANRTFAVRVKVGSTALAITALGNVGSSTITRFGTIQGLIRCTGPGVGTIAATVVMGGQSAPQGGGGEQAFTEAVGTAGVALNVTGQMSTSNATQTITPFYFYARRL